MAVTLPADWNVVDIRDPIPGNSYSWGSDNNQPAAAVKRVVIHGTGSNAPLEDGFTMAAYQMNPPDSWPGIGVNFVCTEDGYPGHPGYTNPGSQIQYVGDLETVRAGVYDMNEGSIHIEISGLFTPGNGVPSETQLRNVRHLLDKILEKNNVLPSINFPSQIVYHNQIAVAGYGTECPGWQHPQFNEWFGYLQGGAEPSWWTATPPPVVIPDPAPVVGGMGNGQPQAPVVPVTVIPEYESSWTPLVDVRTVEQSGAFAIDATTGAHLTDIAVGTIVQIAGYFTLDGIRYARSQWAASNNKWNGIDAAFFDTPGQTNAPVIPVTVSDAVASDVTDAQLKEALSPTTQKVTLIDLLKEIGAWIVALFIKGKK